jgi:hypothetical protein
MSYFGQPIFEPAAEGSITLADTVCCVVGQTPTLLTKPSGAKHLVLQADQGGFRIRAGDFSGGGMQITEFPAATVTDGTAGVHLRAGERRVFPGPQLVTVAGYAADSALTYYWV